MNLVVSVELCSFLTESSPSGLKTKFLLVLLEVKYKSPELSNSKAPSVSELGRGLGLNLIIGNS